MLDRLIDTLHRAMTTPRGDEFAPVRVQKDLARRMNAALGQPVCSKEDLKARRSARERLEALRRAPKASAREELLAPVLVYFEGDRNTRELGRIEELLGAKGIPYRRLDVAGDEATIAFVTRKAACERDELPVVFVADKVIGGLRAVVDADVSGALARAVRGGDPAS